jgi:DNA-binding PadR family transcriptional regulator
MKIESSSEALTELEGAVLAVLSRIGPATAYQLKEAFRGSPSSFWSGSAGAVYPLAKRLETRGLLGSKDVSDTKRPRREFALTAAGGAALRAWLGDVERALDMGYDPLRTRLTFIDLLEEGARERFLDAVDARIMDPVPPDELPQTRRLHDLWLRARRSWLRGFRKAER